MATQKYLDGTGLSYLWNKLKSVFYTKPSGGIPSTDLADAYAGAQTAGGAADKAVSIPFATVDGTSTSTAYTATVAGITELRDGVCVYLRNNVVTSASGCTIDINSLGAKPIYTTTGNESAVTTTYANGYTMLFVYNSSRVEGGCWDMYYGYANSTGYALRSQNTSLPASQKFYRYRLLFTSADGTHFVPANTSSSTNATAARSANQTKIDPFGRIMYYSYTTAINAESRPSISYLYYQNSLTLGYSFNTTGAALTLTQWTPVYIKCTPQSDGSAIIDSTTPYTQSLPNTDDGKIYIMLGIAYSATQVELTPTHPIYYYKDGAIRLWTGQYGDLTLSITAGGSAQLTSGTYTRISNAYTAKERVVVRYMADAQAADVVECCLTDYASGSSAFIFTGWIDEVNFVTIYIYDDDSFEVIANVVAAASGATPLMDGTAAIGTSYAYARADHVHPTDTSLAPINSPTFTGNPTAPTQPRNNNSTRLATTAFVQTATTLGSCYAIANCGCGGALSGGMLFETAFAKIERNIVDDELATAAALNDLDGRVTCNSCSITALVTCNASNVKKQSGCGLLNTRGCAVSVKTINNCSLTGSGNIAINKVCFSGISSLPSGATGQFMNINGSAKYFISSMPYGDSSDVSVAPSWDAMNTLLMSLSTISSSSTSATLVANTYYRHLSTGVTSLTLTLPTIASGNTFAQHIIVYIKTGTSPTLTITPPSGVTVKYVDGYSIDDGSEYEISMLWNGDMWIVASNKLAAS